MDLQNTYQKVYEEIENRMYQFEKNLGKWFRYFLRNGVLFVYI